jgi:hypothetical protein
VCVEGTAVGGFFYSLSAGVRWSWCTGVLEGSGARHWRSKWCGRALGSSLGFNVASRRRERA